MKKRNIVIAAIAGTVIAGVAYAIKKANDGKLKREAALDHSKEQMVNPDDVPFTNASAFIDNAPCVWLYVALSHADEIRSYDNKLIFIFFHKSAGYPVSFWSKFSMSRFCHGFSAFRIWNTIRSKPASRRGLLTTTIFLITKTVDE